MAELSREDVLQILEIIDKSPFDFLELQSGDLKLTVSKTGAGKVALDNVALPVPRAAAPAAAQPAAPTPAVLAAAQPAAASQPQRPAAAAHPPEGLVAVPAPIVGTFYAQPEPGAPPYVQVGSQVEEDSTLGLVEVMKVFNAVRAGVRGAIAEILVQNAQFVEFGQTLFLIRPEDSADGKQP